MLAGPIVTSVVLSRATGVLIVWVPNTLIVAVVAAAHVQGVGGSALVDRVAAAGIANVRALISGEALAEAHHAVPEPKVAVSLARLNRLSKPGVPPDMVQLLKSFQLLVLPLTTQMLCRLHLAGHVLLMIAVVFALSGLVSTMVPLCEPGNVR